MWNRFANEGPPCSVVTVVLRFDYQNTLTIKHCGEGKSFSLASVVIDLMINARKINYQILISL